VLIWSASSCHSTAGFHTTAKLLTKPRTYLQPIMMLPRVLSTSCFWTTTQSLSSQAQDTVIEYTSPLPPVQLPLYVFFGHQTIIPLCAMNTLQEIIPELLVLHVPRLRWPLSRPLSLHPPEHHVPYWTLHCPTLTDSMMQELCRYLPTAPGGNTPPKSSPPSSYQQTAKQSAQHFCR
jgi:hypothetical protein